MMDPSRMCLMLAAMMLAVATHAIAAPPPLPAEALGDDVVGVLWIDAQQVDGVKATAAIDSVMGRFARPVNEALSAYTRLHAPFIRAGGTSVAIVYFDPYSANSASRGVANPVYLFSMGDNANRAAIESIIEQVSMDEKNKPQAKFEVMGKWLMAYDGRLARPYMERGKAERMESLRAALEPIDKNPVTLGFVPSNRMRGAYSDRIGLDPKTPKDLLIFIRTLLECRSLTLTATLGSQPSLAAVVKMSDAEMATQLAETRKPAIDALDPFMKRSDMRGVPIELITQLTSYHAVLSNNTPIVDRHLVTAVATGATLTRTGESIAAGLMVARQEALIVLSLNQMQALIVALNSYAKDNRGQFPARLEDLAQFSYVKDLNKLLINPVTGQTPGYIYVKPNITLNELVKQKRTARTPILYEAKDGRLNPRGLIGYVNVHIERSDLQE